MEEILKNNGWTMFHQCSCGGTQEKKFKNVSFPRHIIRVQPKANRWTLDRDNRKVVYGKTDDFETKLIEAGILKAKNNEQEAS